MAMDLKQGDLENIILNALWDLETQGAGKVYVANVQQTIRTAQKSWAYTTVKTVLDRLVDKNLAMRAKDGKKYHYNTVLKRDEAGKNALKKVMRQYFKGDVNALLECLKGIGPIDNIKALIRSGDSSASSEAPLTPQTMAALDHMSQAVAKQRSSANTVANANHPA